MVTPHHPRDVACQELVELLTDHLEGVLPPDEAAAVEAHLTACPGCGAYLDQMRATIAALGYVPVETLSEEAVTTLLRAFSDPLH
ncbi:MAG: zf-HC2 domain-containing protein [Dermatophilaceae bacterium]